MAKKANKDDVVRTSFTNLVTYQVIQDAIDAHTARTEGMIRHHLEAVKENTGTILPQDVQYVVSLHNRELAHELKKLFE